MKEPRVVRFELFGAESQNIVGIKLPRGGKVVKVAFTMYNPYIWVLHDYAVKGEDDREFIVSPTDARHTGQQTVHYQYIDTFFNQAPSNYVRGKYYPTEMHLFEVTEEPCT